MCNDCACTRPQASTTQEEIGLSIQKRHIFHMKHAQATTVYLQLSAISVSQFFSNCISCQHNYWGQALISTVSEWVEFCVKRLMSLPIFVKGTAKTLQSVTDLSSRQWPEVSDFVARFCTLHESNNTRTCDNLTQKTRATCKNVWHKSYALGHCLLSSVLAWWNLGHIAREVRNICLLTTYCYIVFPVDIVFPVESFQFLAKMQS